MLGALTNLRLLAALAVLAGASLALVLWGNHREHQGYARGHAEYLALQSEMTAKALKADLEQRSIEQARQQALKENANEAERIAARDRASQDLQRSRTAAASDSLRDTIDAITAGGSGASSGPSLARDRQADLAAIGGVLQACRAEYQQLASDADVELDEARRRGFECAADYDAVKGPK